MADALTESLPSHVAGTVVTVGTFDGMHRGHRDLLERLCERERASGLASLLITFEPHPLEVLNPAAAPPRLTVGPERLEVLAETGVHYVAVLPFTRELASLDAEQFVEILLDRYRMRELLIGYDHGFGRGRSAGAADLQAIGERRGFGVEVVKPVVVHDGLPVSSTAIRRAIAGGDLDRAAEALGRPYSLSGVVVHGDERGRALGYRTINLQLHSSRKLLPPDGVYAVRAATPDGTFGGMMHIGARPTFGDDRLAIEAHLFDAEGDWYDRAVRVDLVSRLRDVRHFPGPDALVAQLRIDEADARVALLSR